MREYPKNNITLKRVKIGDREVSVATSKNKPTVSVVAGSGPVEKAPLVRIRQLAHPGVLD